jgi:hypothetical protein
VSSAGQNKDGFQIRVMGTELVTRRVRVHAAADGSKIFSANQYDDVDRDGSVNFWKWRKWFRNRQI